jgi:hypothetical protein
MLDATGKRAPRQCLLPTGDETDLHFVDAAERAFSESAVEVTCLRLFPMPNVADPAELVCSSDAVFVGGGSVRRRRECSSEEGVSPTCWLSGGSTPLTLLSGRRGSEGSQTVEPSVSSKEHT